MSARRLLPLAALLVGACSNDWRTDMWYQASIRPEDAPRPQPGALGAARRSAPLREPGRHRGAGEPDAAHEGVARPRPGSLPRPVRALSWPRRARGRPGLDVLSAGARPLLRDGPEAQRTGSSGGRSPTGARRCRRSARGSPPPTAGTSSTGSAPSREGYRSRDCPVARPLLGGIRPDDRRPRRRRGGAGPRRLRGGPPPRPLRHGPRLPGRELPLLRWPVRRRRGAGRRGAGGARGLGPSPPPHRRRLHRLLRSGPGRAGGAPPRRARVRPLDRRLRGGPPRRALPAPARPERRSVRRRPRLRRARPHARSRRGPGPERRGRLPALLRRGPLLLGLRPRHGALGRAAIRR